MIEGIELFYHIWAPSNSSTWRLLVDEQIRRIYESKLPDNGNVYCCINSEQHELISEHVSSYKWINVLESGNNAGEYEGFTLKHLFRHCKTRSEDFKVGYIHTKGIHHFDNSSVARFKAVNSWRHFLELGVIDHWRDATMRLDFHDVVGVNFLSQPHKHFSGNFWWANAKHVRRLPDPLDFDLTEKMLPQVHSSLRVRIAYELWICLSEPNVFSFANPPFRSNGIDLNIKNLYEDDIGPYLHTMKL